jgi:hypothetical protein
MGGHVTLPGMQEFPTSFAGGLAMWPAGPELFADVHGPPPGQRPRHRPRDAENRQLLAGPSAPPTDDLGGGAPRLPPDCS